jgi:uncharacterized protein (TIGR03435 family)
MTTMIGWTVAGSLALTLALTSATAQTTFEVASIKRNTSGDGGIVLDISRGQVRAVNVPLQTLIRQAFEVMDAQIVGAPGWVATERYDITAKAPDGLASGELMRPLLRALLADRFMLTTHRERREMPVFALAWARPDRSYGPSLRESSIDCATRNNAAPAPPAPDGDWPECTVRYTPGALYLGGYEMAEFLRMLAPLVGRTLVDETGLAGRVKIRLEFRPQGRAAATPQGGTADDRPDLFSAIEEQLGLKLESRRAPVDVLVIDRLERPTPD